MDLIFKRYASPFMLLDSMIECGRFFEFINEIVGIQLKERDDRQLWELYLHHKFIDISFNEFKEQIGINIKKQQESAPTPSNLEATIKESMQIAQCFGE